jgi:hypothetical protein
VIDTSPRANNFKDLANGQTEVPKIYRNKINVLSAPFSRFLGHGDELRTLGGV